MIRFVLATTVACGLGGGVGALAAQARAVPPGVLRVQRAEVIDRNGFEKPLVAATLFVPVGWKGEGGVVWEVNNPCIPATRFRWRATAPDGGGAIELVPQEQWDAANFPMQGFPCQQARYPTVRAYLEGWVSRNRRGARILDFRARAEMAAPYAALNTTYSSGGGDQLRSWVEAGEVLIAYTECGKEYREAVSAIVAYRHSVLPPIGNSQPMETMHGETLGAFAMRMPAGSLDFTMVDAIRASARPGPEWNQRMIQSANERARVANQAQRQMAADNLRGAQERSAIIAQTARDVNDIQMGTWQSSSATSDRMQRENVERIREVETYRDPHYGGTVQLSNHYQHAWQLRDGTYVLTNDASFDPARAFGVGAQRLERAP
ncbi:MAG: hypothetical protein IPK12_24955 [Gemmatimonadetes bacterium]|nr:hypothetical protein [Gemmatimonadota bacterium]